MCDIMPTIAEDCNSSQGDRDSQVSAEGNTVEDMLLSILDERDRLMENFQEAQEQLNYSQNRLSELEREKDCLSRQLREKVPEVRGLTIPMTQYLSTSRFILNYNKYDSVFLALCIGNP